MKVLVTGASGFIGRAFCARLAGEPAIEVVATARAIESGFPPAPAAKMKVVLPETDWRDVLESVDVIVHAAAHMSGGSAADYRRVNVEGTLNLARQAADCGVGRFVFLSSSKVNGESTRPGQKFHAGDPPAPADAYGISKHEAEAGLRHLRQGCDMELVVIRPALVYGPGAKGHLLALMRWVHLKIPLPFAGIDNARSLIALANLVDLIRLCCEHPRAADDTFMAADREDVSTAELISRLGIALGRPARLVPAPKRLLVALAAVAGKRQQVGKLLGNAQIDASRTRERLAWNPAVSMEEGLGAMARDFLERRR